MCTNAKGKMEIAKIIVFQLFFYQLVNNCTDSENIKAVIITFSVKLMFHVIVIVDHSER